MPCHGDAIIAQWIASTENPGPHASEEASPLPPAAGRGPPRICALLSGAQGYHDGAGLISPGRWDPEHRILADWEGLCCGLRAALQGSLGGESAVDRKAFELAAGSTAALPDPAEPSDLFGAEVLYVARGALNAWLAAPGRAGEGVDLDHVSPGQPLRLRLLGAILREACDADAEIFEQFEGGVTAGALEPMPRAPAVFEELTQWRLGQEALAFAASEHANYSSVAKHADWVRSHLAEEVADGRMEPVTRKAVEERYPRSFAIEAMAVLFSATGKKRLVHDGAHVVAVNNRIRCRNRLRMPRPAEKEYLLRRSEDAGWHYFSLVTDVRRAHRLVKVRREEWGMLACEFEGVVYLKKVGTFGISSAAEWWARLLGGVVRALCHLLVPGSSVELLAYSEDLESLGVDRKGRADCVLGLAVLCSLGFPLQTAKTRGCFRVDWIGARVTTRPASSVCRYRGRNGWPLGATAQWRPAASRSGTSFRAWGASASGPCFCAEQSPSWDPSTLGREPVLSEGDESCRSLGRSTSC